MEQLGVTAAQAIEFGDRVKTLEGEVKHLNKETQRLTEAYQSERVRGLYMHVHVITVHQNNLPHIWKYFLGSEEEVLQYGGGHEGQDKSLL